jgi:hypothetical protein
MSILDQVASSRAALAQFRPQAPNDFFALRLAQKLAEPATAAHYAALLSEYSPHQLLWSYRRALRQACATTDLGRRFHCELRRLAGVDGDTAAAVKLAAFKAERRSVAVAIFNGDVLDYTQVRQLSSAQDRAQASTIGFVKWILGTFGIESAAIETARLGQDIRRAVLTNTVVDVLRAEAIPLWQVSKGELLAAYGQRPLKSRRQLREVVTGLWPLLRSGSARAQVVDAVALGLFVQTERLFL